MYRVVTKAMVFQNGVRRRQIDLGPWQPMEESARRWADYLKATGHYDEVTVQSNGQSSSTNDQSSDSSGEDLFLEAGN